MRPSDPLFTRAVDEFNRGEFFEAHESWEEIWDEADEPERTFLQGLIQAATALHHLGRGRFDPAGRLLAKSLGKLAPYDDGFGGIALARLRDDLRAIQSALPTIAAGTTAAPSMPRIGGAP